MGVYRDDLRAAQDRIRSLEDELTRLQARPPTKLESELKRIRHRRGAVRGLVPAALAVAAIVLFIRVPGLCPLAPVIAVGALLWAWWSRETDRVRVRADMANPVVDRVPSPTSAPGQLFWIEWAVEEQAKDGARFLVQLRLSGQLESSVTFEERRKALHMAVRDVVSRRLVQTTGASLVANTESWALALRRDLESRLPASEVVVFDVRCLE